jgi:hypothetical protein
MSGLVSKRGRRIFAIPAAVAIIVSATSCASARPDMSLAKTDCVAAGRELGAPPGDHAVWIRQIIGAPPSGARPLDAAMRSLADALRGVDTAKTNRAFSDVATVCARLGLWQSYH